MCAKEHGGEKLIRGYPKGGEELGLDFRLRVILALRLDKLLTGTLLLSKASLLDSVIASQLTRADKQCEDKAKTSHGGVEDPHAVQGMCVGAKDDLALGGSKAFDEGLGGAAKGSHNSRSGFSAQGGDKLG